MKTKNVLGIYNYLTTDMLGTSARKAAYYLVYLITEKGILNVFELGLVDNMETRLGPFEELEDLHQFASRLCEKLAVKTLQLISVEEYNQIMSKREDGPRLYENLMSGGTFLERPENTKKRPSILGKMFIR